MTNNCEIVSNVACGKEFQYCRTHKVEPHQCPGAKQEVVFQTPWMTLEPRPGYKGIGVDPAAPTPKREFKVGDKVRRVDGMYGQMRPGHMGTITGFTPQGLLLAEFAGEHDERMFEVVK